MPKLGRMIFKKKGRDSVERFLLSMLKEYQQEQRSDEALWCRIVVTAWQDAFYKPSAMSRHADNAARQCKRDAIGFLTGEHTWNDHRERVCSNSEISASWIKQEALKALKEGPPQPSPPACRDGREQNKSDFQGMKRSITRSMTLRRKKKKGIQKTGAELWEAIK